LGQAIRLKFASYSVGVQDGVITLGQGAGTQDIVMTQDVSPIVPNQPNAMRTLYFSRMRPVVGQTYGVTLGTGTSLWTVEVQIDASITTSQGLAQALAQKLSVNGVKAVAIDGAVTLSGGGVGTLDISCFVILEHLAGSLHVVLASALPTERLELRAAHTIDVDVLSSQNWVLSGIVAGVSGVPGHRPSAAAHLGCAGDEKRLHQRRHDLGQHQPPSPIGEHGWGV